MAVKVQTKQQLVLTFFLLFSVAFPAFFSQHHLCSSSFPLLFSVFLFLLLVETPPFLLPQVLLSYFWVLDVQWYPSRKIAV